MRPIITTLVLALSSTACAGSTGDAADAAGPAPREGDPALEHTWTMPAESSVLASGDLGSEPPATAAALMEGGAMPSIAHRIAQHCAKADALRGVDTAVLRFSVAEGGKVGVVEADPSGPAGTCLAEALTAELERRATQPDTHLAALPAGAALLRIRLHPRS